MRPVVHEAGRQAWRGENGSVGNVDTVHGQADTVHTLRTRTVRNTSEDYGQAGFGLEFGGTCPACVQP